MHECMTANDGDNIEKHEGKPRQAALPSSELWT